LAETERTVEDRLREEYFTLLPEIRRVAERLEAEIRYYILPISGRLHRHETLDVKCRIKSCESAVDKLRRRQQGSTFQRNRPELYSLSGLNDLAGVRVLAFPRGRLAEVDNLLREAFRTWTPDPVDVDGEIQALKYFGYCPKASDRVKGEYQVVSVLTGLFWEVEHAAIYKPDARLRGIADHRGMRERTKDVTRALRAFEDQFEALARQS
jgi:ppGpp synthetase/RelA/SpoT-type nucleotidyltranferase